MRFYRNFYQPAQHDPQHRRRRRSATRRCGRVERAVRRAAERRRRSRDPGPARAGITTASDIASWRATSRRRSSRSAGARRARCTPTRRCSTSLRHGARQRPRVAALSRRARAQAGVVGDARTTTRRPSSACSSCTRRRAGEHRGRGAARSGISSRRCATDALERARARARAADLRVAMGAPARDMEGQANYLAEWEALGDWQLGDEYFERFMSASRRTMSSASRERYLDRGAGGGRSSIVRRARRSSRRMPPRCARCSSRDVRAARRRFRARAAPARPTATRAPSSKGRRRASRVSHGRGGFPILVRRKAGAPIVHAGVYIVGGAVDEKTASAGLTLLTGAHGAQGHDARARAAQIAEDAEMLGGSVGGERGQRELRLVDLGAGSASGRRRSSCWRDVVQHPTIPEDALETESDRRARRTSRCCATTCTAIRCDWRTSSAFGGHPYGVPAMGTEESLARDRGERRARVASRAACSTSAARDRDRRRCRARRGGDARGARRSRAAHAARSVRWSRSRAGRRASTIAPSRATRRRRRSRCAFPAPSRTDDARFAATCIADVASGLGGRFFDELRDKPVARVHGAAAASERRLAGMFVSYIATSPEKEEIARDGLLGRVRQAARGAGDGGGAGARARSTRSARTRSVRRAAARCSGRCSTRGCSAAGCTRCSSTSAACAPLPRMKCETSRGSTLIPSGGWRG